MPIIKEEDYLEHYGVKGMKWGVRKQIETRGRQLKTLRQEQKRRKKLYKDVEKTRSRLHDAAFKKYKVEEAYNKADKYYNNEEYEKAEKWQAEGDQRASKAYREVTQSLKNAYGKDYKLYEKHEQNVAYAVAGSGVVLTVLGMYGAKKLTELAGKGALKVGEWAVDKIFK